MRRIHLDVEINQISRTPLSASLSLRIFSWDVIIIDKEIILSIHFLFSASSSDAAELQADRYGFAAGDAIPADLAAGMTDGATVADFVSALDRTYCGTMSVEFDAVHVSEIVICTPFPLSDDVNENS